MGEQSCRTDGMPLRLTDALPPALMTRDENWVRGVAPLPSGEGRPTLSLPQPNLLDRPMQPTWPDLYATIQRCAHVHMGSVVPYPASLAMCNVVLHVLITKVKEFIYIYVDSLILH